MRAIIEHADDFTRHAEHVREFLGDYLTFTAAKERRVLARSVMFYGYLRFSLRFVFWTMPVKHPVVAAITPTSGGWARRRSSGCSTCRCSSSRGSRAS
jgi:hypothetical protein